jgi:hypothetical protein
VPDRPQLTLVVLGLDRLAGEIATKALIEQMLREYGSAGRTPEFWGDMSEDIGIRWRQKCRLGTEVGEWLQDIRGKTPHARFVANDLFDALPHDLFRVVDGLGPRSSKTSSSSTCTDALGVTTASCGASPPSPSVPACGAVCTLSNSRLTCPSRIPVSTVMRSLTARRHRAVVGRARGGTRLCRPLG